ncbi:SDR family oxidoreductase [Arvimicrobium flavum]|uniref:SDR family oxidoreductase n=1 Tax=Arvimicrobium flavum TaxID=3393320 RepID=UPI00237BF2D1|nr:SDR family oxidoreductase [Mesorhizobium shangrilense]
MFKDDLLDGKRILVTGGGTGLGKSMASRFSELGAVVIIAGRREAVLEETAAEISARSGRKVHTKRLDVRDPDMVERVFDEIWADGPLTSLLNNAAGNFIAQTERLSSRAFDAVTDIVLGGTAYCTLAAGRRWIEAGLGGNILSIVTTAAWTGQPFTAPSAAAKAGVLALMRTLAVEWGPKHIRTAAIAPGYFHTDGAWDRMYPEGAISEPLHNEIPARRMGDHAELANLASYIMSDAASYITGECIVIDGGRWLGGANGFATRPLFTWDNERWDRARDEMRGAR